MTPSKRNVDEVSDDVSNDEDDTSTNLKPQAQRQRLLQHMKALAPPHLANESSLSYKEQWEQRRKSTPLHMHVQDCIVCNDPTDEDDNSSLLVVCTSLGEMMAWNFSVLDPQANKSIDATPVLPTSNQQTPKFRQKISAKPLLALCVHTSKEKNGFYVGGDDGLWFVHTTTKAEQKNDNQGPLELTKLHHQPVREMLCDGDCVLSLTDTQVLVWSIQTHQILHSINVGSSATTMALSNIGLPLDDGNDGASLLLLGTRNSRILTYQLGLVQGPRITEPPKLVDTLVLHEEDQSPSTSKEKQGKLTVPISVTSICVSQDSWWTIAGTFRGSSAHSSKGNHAKGGILATWHGPTRSLVSLVETRETIHQVANYDGSLLGTPPTLFTVANEGVVRVWESPYRLNCLRRIWATPPSGISITTIASKQMAVVCGVGNQVDLLDEQCRIATVALP